MKRNIIYIDEEKCDGCGNCVPGCAEGALQVIDGKARLVKDSYCDGLGACIGECPQGALTIIEREADEFDEEAVNMHLAGPSEGHAQDEKLPCGCPGSAVRNLNPDTRPSKPSTEPQDSMLASWPVQIKLVPPSADFLRNAHLLICADCTAFAVPDFHERYLKGRIPLVGCPKLDDISSYEEKFREIFRESNPASITVLRMEVPCCSGITGATLAARDALCPDMPVDVHTIGIRGDIVTESIPSRAEI